MEQFHPLVSIVIPVYNGANFLSQAIDSALAQTYDNIEILVINDGSNDNGATERIALSYGDKIRYFSKINGGVSSALNFGIERMRGDYFSWLSHDDLYAPEKIAFQVNQITQIENKQNTIAICGSKLINAEGNSLVGLGRKQLVGLYTNEQMFIATCHGYNINGCALLIPKVLFSLYGLFKPLRYQQDIECWYRFMLNGVSFICANESLSFIRIHGKQTTVLAHELYYKDRVEVSRYLIDALTQNIVENDNMLKAYYHMLCRIGDNESLSIFPVAIKRECRLKAIWWKIIGHIIRAMKYINNRYIKGYKRL